MKGSAADRRSALKSELESTRSEFHGLLDILSDDDLRRPSANSGWSNAQIVWHIAFGFMVAVTLLPLARFFSSLPSGVSKAFASVLDWSTPVFNVVNRWGPRGGARIHSRASIGRWLDWTVDRLVRMVDSMKDSQLDRGMYFPQRWDPNSFRPYMTVEMILRYPVQHMRHHVGQVSRASSQ